MNPSAHQSQRSFQRSYEPKRQRAPRRDYQNAPNRQKFIETAPNRLHPYQHRRQRLQNRNHPRQTFNDSWRNRQPLQTTNPSTQNIFEEEKPKVYTVFSLLKSLQEKGLIPSTSTSQSESDIWGNLTLPRLKIRNQETIDGILTKRDDCCKTCGFKLDNSGGKSQMWKDHMDAHFWENFKDIETRKPKKTVVQPWYHVSKTEEVLRDSEASEAFEDVISSGSKVTSCCACNEKFEEYFDDEEEVWRFKSSTEKNGQIVHRQCAVDSGAVAPKIEKDFHYILVD